MIRRKVFSYDKERDYYSRNWPTEALGYEDLNYYLISWLGDLTDGIFRGRRILDIGAGEATYTRFIAERYSPELIVALELFHRRLLPALRSSNLPGFCAVAGDCFHIPFADEVFDVVFGSLILHQLPNVDAVAGEVARVLKPGGIYVGIEPNFKNPVILCRFLFGKHSANQYLLRIAHLRQFERSGFDLGIRYFYWKFPRIRSSVISTCIGVLLSKKNIVLSEVPVATTLQVIIPSGKRANLIFRTEVLSPLTVEPPQSGEIVIARGITESYHLLRPWLLSFGMWELLRLGMKLIFGNRIVAAVVVGSEVASYAWLYRIHPFDFPVDEGDCSISLVSTNTFYRGRQLADVLIKTLINVGIELGHGVFFMETASDNERMIRVIRKIGIWDLVGSYLRLGKRFR